MKSTWLVSIVDMTDFVRILDLSKPSAAVKLGPTSSLLVAKVLTGSRSKKSCGRVVSMQRRLNRLNATDQHALRFQHCDAFSMDCRGLEICLRCQPRNQCQCGRSLETWLECFLHRPRVCAPLDERREARA